MENNFNSILAEDVKTCPAVGFQKAKVCVPVTIKPFAKPGHTTTTCCGEPIIAKELECEGILNGQCSFTISQELCIEVPVEFGAMTTVGAPSVKCDEISGRDICKSCHRS